MKKLLLLGISLVLLGILAGCKNDPKERGVWVITNINCPDILAQKDSEIKTFLYPENTLASKPQMIRNCQANAKIGGTIVVDEYGVYSIFPPAPTP